MFVVYSEDKVLIFQDQMDITKSSSGPLLIYLPKVYIKCMSLVAELLQTV